MSLAVPPAMSVAPAVSRDAITAFEASLRQDGFVEIETKAIADHHTAEHGHHFAVRILVLNGAFALTRAGAQRVYQPGETFTVAEAELHAEDIGADGASYVVGRKY